MKTPLKRILYWDDSHTVQGQIQKPYQILHPRKFKTETTLSQYIWKLKNEKKEFDIKWKIVARAKPFTPVSGICALCTLEKFYIITKPNLATLNRNEEIYNSCRHKTGLLLDKT